MKLLKEMQVSLAAQAPLVVQPAPPPKPSFQIGDMVRYTIPEPHSKNPWPAWVEHSGQVLQVDRVGQMVLVVPKTESVTAWRWVAW